MFPDHWTVRCQGLQPSLLQVTRGKLLACDAGDHRAWVCWDDLKFIPALIDDEKGVSGEASRAKLEPRRFMCNRGSLYRSRFPFVELRCRLCLRFH
jgi:hypothetical protein